MLVLPRKSRESVVVVGGSGRGEPVRSQSVQIAGGNAKLVFEVLTLLNEHSRINAGNKFEFQSERQDS